MNRRWTTTGFVAAILGGTSWLLIAATAANAVPRSCALGGKTYYHRAVSCQDGAAYECDDGSWRALERSC